MVSVLISVYIKEKAKNLEEALESIINQTLLPTELVLVKDGPLNEALDNVIAVYEKKFTKKGIDFKQVALEDNKGLSVALNEGLKLCTCEYIARMDSDDISDKERLNLQLEFLENNKDIAVIGSDIAEFVEKGKVLRVKKMPVEHEKLYKYAKLRNPLNHMSVVFRKQVVESLGGYIHLPYLEDYYLWSRLLARGEKISNISKPLVWARVDRDFAARRGGFAYFKNYILLRKKQREIKFTNFFEYILGVTVCAGMVLQPKFIRNIFYSILRR